MNIYTYFLCSGLACSGWRFGFGGSGSGSGFATLDYCSSFFVSQSCSSSWSCEEGALPHPHPGGGSAVSCHACCRLKHALRSMRLLKHARVIEANPGSYVYTYTTSPRTPRLANPPVTQHLQLARPQLSVPCVITPVPTPPMPSDPDGSRDWGPVLGGHRSFLRKLLDEVEGESWWTGEATRRRVFMG